jgi:hypothetical protein
MVEDDEKEEMPEQDSPDEDDGCNVGRSRHDWCRHRLQEPGEEAEAQLAGIQPRTNEKGIWLIESEQPAKCGCHCNWPQAEINMAGRKFDEWIHDDVAADIAPIDQLGVGHLWNALEKQRELQLLADLVLVLMTIPLAGVGTEPIFSLKHSITGTIAARTTAKLLHAPADISGRAHPSGTTQ